MARKVWFDLQTAYTPRGRFALPLTTVTTILITTQRRYTPGWAIACLVGFIWLLPFSLLFLFARRDRVDRDLRITFTDGTKSYTFEERIGSDEHLEAVMRHVAFLRSVRSPD